MASIRKLVILFSVCSLSATITVPTAQYDNTRNGVNSQETILTPSNVSTVVTQNTWTLDGPIYSQVLYVPGVTISAVVYNVLIVATMNNTVYALNADAPASPVLWSTNFGTAWSSYPDAGNFYHQSIGILSTPVIDVSGGYIYAVTVNNTPTYTLRKISLTTGVQSTSINITASVTGSGTGSSGGTLAFSAANENQRVPLTLAGGNVYVAFSASNEGGGSLSHGWIISYDTATLTQQAVFCTTPNGIFGGIWESSGGMAADGSGNIYAVTGNGTYDGAASSDYGQTVIKLNSSLVVQDWFTPSNNSTTTSEDADLSSGRAMLIPGTTLLTIGSKDGRIWVIDTTSMGHLQGSGTAPQVFAVPDSFTPSSSSGIYGGMFFNSTGYFPVNGFDMHAYAFSGSTYTTTPAASTGSAYSQVMTTGSSNAGVNPIAWAVTVSSSPFSTAQTATLHAMNPLTLVDYASWTSFGHYAKFVCPTVANGRVYVPTNDGTVVAFGLPVPTSLSGSASLSGSVSIQ